MKYLVCCLSILLYTPIFGQITEGEIIYELKVDAHRNIPDEMSSLKDRIPPYRTSKHSLLFTFKESIYKRVKSQESEEAGPGNRRRRWSRNRENSELYRNLEEGTSIESTEFFGKKFLVAGEARPYHWKITGKTKQVGDYLCQQATYQDSSQNVMVWYTPMIPIISGPENFGGLPGMILFVDINNGERVITALEINNKELPDDSISHPTEGREISREEFEKLRKEKMEELREEFGGNRRMFFRGNRG